MDDDAIVVRVFMIIGIIMGLISVSIFASTYHMKTYQKCRYYGQSIEFCVNDLGWEKK